MTFMRALVQLHRQDTTLVLSRDTACEMHSLPGFACFAKIKKWINRFVWPEKNSEPTWHANKMCFLKSDLDGSGEA